MAMRMAVMALRKAAEAKMKTRKAMRLIHSIRSRKVMDKSVEWRGKFVNCFLLAGCKREARLQNKAVGRRREAAPTKGKVDAPNSVEAAVFSFSG
jgi:hypothetical protein